MGKGTNLVRLPRKFAEMRCFVRAADADAHAMRAYAREHLSEVRDLIEQTIKKHMGDNVTLHWIRMGEAQSVHDPKENVPYWSVNSVELEESEHEPQDILTIRLRSTGAFLPPAEYDLFMGKKREACMRNVAFSTMRLLEQEALKYWWTTFGWDMKWFNAEGKTFKHTGDGRIRSNRRTSD